MQLLAWVAKRHDIVKEGKEEMLVTPDAVKDFVKQWNKEYPPKDAEEKTLVVSSQASKLAAHLMEPMLVTYLDVSAEKLLLENSVPAENIPEVPIARAQLAVGDLTWKKRTDDQKADL